MGAATAATFCPPNPHVSHPVHTTHASSDPRLVSLLLCVVWYAPMPACSQPRTCTVVSTHCYCVQCGKYTLHTLLPARCVEGDPGGRDLQIARKRPPSTWEFAKGRLWGAWPSCLEPHAPHAAQTHSPGMSCGHELGTRPWRPPVAPTHLSLQPCPSWRRCWRPSWVGTLSSPTPPPSPGRRDNRYKQSVKPVPH